MFQRPRQPQPPPDDPDEVLIGTCSTCRRTVEVPRSAALPATEGKPGQRPPVRGWWDEVPTVECPFCAAEAAAKYPGHHAGAHGPPVPLRPKELLP